MYVGSIFIRASQVQVNVCKLGHIAPAPVFRCPKVYININVAEVCVDCNDLREAFTRKKRK